MPLTFFYGSRFRMVKEFLENVTNDYNEEEINDHIFKNEYREGDVQKFFLLIRDALLSETPA
jgi:hypothetical protein